MIKEFSNKMSDEKRKGTPLLDKRLRIQNKNEGQFNRNEIKALFQFPKEKEGKKKVKRSSASFFRKINNRFKI